MSGLRRLAAGPFTLAHSHSLEQLRTLLESQGEAALDALLLPVEHGVSAWPALQLDSRLGLRLWQGQTIRYKDGPYGMVRIYSDGRFLGIGRHLPDGGFSELRLLRYPDKPTD